MQFLTPQFLWLLLLGIIPLMLYLFRRKSKTVNVSTLVFFKTLAREHQESAWLRRLKKWLSFALTILILSLAVFVLSRLIAKQDDPDQYRTVVILLDRSASMGVVDDNGESRLEAGKRILRERLGKVPEEVGVALIAYDVRPEVLQPRTLKRRELISRLDSVSLRPMSDDPAAALDAAKLIAGLEEPAAIWHASDHRLLPETEESEEGVSAENADPLPEGLVVRELDLSLPEVLNGGITAFQIRPVPLEYSRYEIYVQLALNEAASAEVQSRLEVSVGGIPNQYREIDLKPGERIGLTFRLNGVSEQLLHLHLKTEGDLFHLDDHVTIPLPDAQPVLAAWIRPDDAEDPYTRFALSSVQESGSFELLKGSPDAWPLSEEVDAVIFDGWLPEEWPEDIPAIVINPPGSSGPVLARALTNPIPYDSIRVGNEEHPVLFRVSSSRIAVTQTAVFQSTGSLEPLWLAGREPVLAAGEVKGQRLVVMGFSPGRSERLPLTASFPLLIGNALLWAVDRDMESTGVELHSSGNLAKVSGKSITWQQWKGDELQTVKLPLANDVLELDRIGVWETDEGVRGASHILSAKESNIMARAGEADTSSDDYFAVEGSIGARLKLWLLSAVVVILLLESFLFHRFSVY
ncbi:MAG: BatA and WFA domain-containing protein [Verrucomicrobiales bacterium]|nr:BatA and WFA domain-containing protein [Verrucomicrobiales bacterium]